MITPRIALRLLPEEELAADVRREACVEVSFGHVRPAGDPDLLTIPSPLRITPADLVRLRLEAELVLGEMRTEVMRAEIAWREQLGRWYEEGRQAVETREPDIGLLARVLEGLRNKRLAPAERDDAGAPFHRPSTPTGAEDHEEEGDRGGRQRNAAGDQQWPPGGRGGAERRPRPLRQPALRQRR